METNYKFSVEKKYTMDVPLIKQFPIHIDIHTFST